MGKLRDAEHEPHPSSIAILCGQPAQPSRSRNQRERPPVRLVLARRTV